MGRHPGKVTLETHIAVGEPIDSIFGTSAIKPLRVLYTKYIKENMDEEIE